MEQIESPAARAYWKLTNLARLGGIYDAQLFALTWLAAGRMVVTEQVNGISTIDQLAEPNAWRLLLSADFPKELYDAIATQQSQAVAHNGGRRDAAAAIVSELAMELGQHPWDILPCITDAGSRRDAADGTVVPELAALLMDMVDAPADSEVWIPFDGKGQLTVETLRRGWRVLSASPLTVSQVSRQLLLMIETGQCRPSRVRTEVDRDEVGRPVLRADYALIVPPVGMRIRDQHVLTWDIMKTRTHEQYARSESWALSEFANRIDKRAVFLTPQGVLFNKGQEQRLRETLLHRDGKGSRVKAVVTLPPGVFGSSGIAGAITVMSNDAAPDTVYMADLGHGRRALVEAGDIVSAGREIALGLLESDKARHVGYDEIEENEFSFAPSRYLQRIADLRDAAVKLGDICEAVRPPASAKETTPYEVAEVGLPDMRQWRPVNHDIEKTVYLKAAPKTSALVQPGDIVITIKGSVGRVALMGTSAQRQPIILSQSCLALRLNPCLGDKNLSPEVLLMYLRSPHGQAQLTGLQVGAGVQHISPATLLSTVSVPIPSEQAYVEIRQDYDRLCELENQIANLEGEIVNISSRRWPDNNFATLSVNKTA
ncbi:N-6 DNA methylase [Paraburkholderia sp. JPY419]|uniref:restriction endonuclease subunit S n=1 Tax=Paraburkholderia sp. JPY419 TaxID=667660 RepID=UPI003D20C892